VVPVSNSNMGLLRFMKRGALFVGVSAIIFVAGVSVYLRIVQYRFRRQAEQLQEDVRGLELRKASAAEVRRVVKKWGFEEWGRGPGPGGPCTEDDCIYRFELMPKTGRGVFSNPFASAGVTFPLEWLGLRPTVVHASVQIQARVLASVSFSVWTLGRGCDRQGRLECTLMGYADTKQRRNGWSSHQQPDIKLKQYLLHPSYLVGAFPEWLNADTGGSPAVIVWTELSPDANTEDVSRLMRFDLNCLTSFLACRERDLMPAVWAQSVEDARQSPKVLSCTPEVSKRVAQLADAVAVVRPKTVELSPPRYKGGSPRLRELEIINVIKQPEKYAPQLTTVYVDKPEMMTTADSGSPLRAGQEYVFLLQDHNTPQTGWMALYPCGALSLNDANLAMAREATGNGAD
jgi:hypothetical protein